MKAREKRRRRKLRIERQRNRWREVYRRAIDGMEMVAAYNTTMQWLPVEPAPEAQL